MVRYYVAPSFEELRALWFQVFENKVLAQLFLGLYFFHAVVSVLPHHHFRCPAPAFHASRANVSGLPRRHSRPPTSSFKLSTGENCQRRWSRRPLSFCVLATDFILWELLRTRL